MLREKDERSDTSNGGAVSFAAGPGTEALWKDVQPIVRDIERLPFLDELASGTLAPKAFVNYLLQDRLYLRGYARAMALLAARAGTPDEGRFWADSSATALAVEEGMHAALLADPRLGPRKAEILGNREDAEPSPTTLGYVSFLTATAAVDPYPVGVAGVLPCFWVYAHAGKVLVEKAGKLEDGHPYRTWVATYDSADFDRATRRAVSILERHLMQADEAGRQRMISTFTLACRYELRFWATAHRFEDWTFRAA